MTKIGQRGVGLEREDDGYFSLMPASERFRLALSVVAASFWYPDSVSAARMIAVVRSARQI